MSLFTGDKTMAKGKTTKQLLLDVKAEWFDNLQVHQMWAKLARSRYEYLIESGFTKEEALDIVKARGIDT